MSTTGKEATETGTARILLEVVAGLVPGKDPIPEYTRQWAITSAQWEEATAQGSAAELLADRNGRALGYAALLALQPDVINWVRFDWIYL